MTDGSTGRIAALVAQHRAKTILRRRRIASFPKVPARLKKTGPVSGSEASQLAGLPGEAGFRAAAQAATGCDVARVDGARSAGRSQGMLAQPLSVRIVLSVAWAFRLPIAGSPLRSLPVGSVAFHPQNGAEAPGRLWPLHHRSTWAGAALRNGVAAGLTGAQSSRHEPFLGQEQWLASFRLNPARSQWRRRRMRGGRLHRNSYTSGPLQGIFVNTFIWNGESLGYKLGFYRLTAHPAEISRRVSVDV